MIGISLTDGGVELLGQRRGLDAYLSAGKTMGLPILYPWANRLSANTYRVDGELVDIVPGAPGVRTDDNGLPIHGLLAADHGWRVTAQSADELVAELDFGARAELLASFPFPHLLEVGVTLRHRTLTVRTVVTPTADKAVPLCFGFHPYLQLPGVPRQQWTVQTPALRHLPVDGRGLPTGASTRQPAASQTLGDKVFDDGYDEVADGALFAVSGGSRRIEVVFEQGYPAAQIFAPAGAELDLLRADGRPDRCAHPRRIATARPGQAAVAQFSIRVA